MVQLQIQETATGWHVNLHSFDRFKLNQDCTFDNKRAALQKRERLTRTVAYGIWTTANKVRTGGTLDNSL